MLCCLGCRWFLGQIKRVDAEKLLLMDINDVGAYLVRESESVPGLFVCLFVCLFVGLLACSLICLFVCLFVCLLHIPTSPPVAR